MAKPYSDDLRRRAIETISDGATIPEAAEQCRISISSMVRFLKLHRETGSVSLAKFGGYKEPPIDTKLRRGLPKREFNRPLRPSLSLHRSAPEACTHKCQYARRIEKQRQRKAPLRLEAPQRNK